MRMMNTRTSLEVTLGEHYIGLPLHSTTYQIGQILRLPFPVVRPVHYIRARSGTKVYQSTSVHVTYTANTDTLSDAFSGHTHMYFQSKLDNKTLTLSTLPERNKHFAMWWWRNGPSSPRHPAVDATGVACHHLRRAFATGPDPYGRGNAFVTHVEKGRSTTTLDIRYSTISLSPSTFLSQSI